ncbi:MAG: type 1 glutamine amidotransferase domain-containing protein [Cyanobacteria bacterium Co-bin13]|nr:type 1 glutamine amidotransferase domain-containing protein [Cyanobacteria bacterium Co-bin13]
MNILMVLTSHAELGTTGHKTGFWLEEFAAPYYTFVDAGATVTLASPAGGQPPVDPRSAEPESQTEATQRFGQDSEAQARLAQTLPLSTIDPQEYDAIFFPGGHGPMWDLATDEDNARLVETFYRQGKVIGAVCHGPAALVLAQDSQGQSILKGKQVTGFTNEEEVAVALDQVVPFALETRLAELGGQFHGGAKFEPNVKVDGRLVTGQNPPSSEPTAKAVIQVLKQV